ncbi:penicillin-binding protein 2 [Akkermansiaceae bacterium]|nr:penicillin-binding protein 2 [Akkermansiaceae bacterium]
MMEFGLKLRAFIVCLVLVTGLSALSVRLINLQVWERRMSDKSQVSRFQLETVIPASRGRIADRHDQVLAQNYPVAALMVDRNHLNHSDNLAKAVTHRFASQTIGWKKLTDEERRDLLRKIKRERVSKMSSDEVIAEHLEYASEVIGRALRIPSVVFQKNILEDNIKKDWFALKKDIPEEQVREIENELQRRSIQGFFFERSQKRYYTMPNSASHIVGFKNDEGNGLGIEIAYDDLLSGRDGQRQLKRDENGLVMLTEASAWIPPKVGKDIRLTLDMGIQAIAEDELDKACRKYNSNRGSIIITDPHTGDILAMASRPRFNLNLRNNLQEPNVTMNFPVEGSYEAGSVMKLVAMTAALDSGRVNRNTEVNCGWGGITRGRVRIPDHHPYGDLSFDKVMMKSSNPGVFQFAEIAGREAFYDYLKRFGFCQRTGIPLQWEARGSHTDSSNLQNFAQSTFGYGVSVSPLQLAMAYSAVANGGYLMKPRLVDSVIASNGIVVEQTPVTKVCRVMKERTAREMCLTLEQVVLAGTGRNAKVSGFRIGGKTGTAWKWDPDMKPRAGYNKKKYFLTFAGIVPVQDPKFVCIVTIDEPKEPMDVEEDFHIGGGTVAAPVFSDVAKRVVEQMNIAPTEPVDEELADLTK